MSEAVHTPACRKALAIIRASGHGSFDRLFVAEVVVLDRLQVVVHLIYKRLARGNIGLDDVAVRHVVEVFDERPQAVAMRDDNHLLPGPYCRSNGRMPIR